MTLTFEDSYGVIGWNHSQTYTFLAQSFKGESGAVDVKKTRVLDQVNLLVIIASHAEPKEEIMADASTNYIN